MNDINWKPLFDHLDDMFLEFHDRLKVIDAKLVDIKNTVDKINKPFNAHN